ncbi:MAG TPA: helix-turn-helix transcriptional regulator [Candidatus Dormibacteraeota bacterium]|nr:helix-turn-helix transcriptional regulator [Candidatus Dormibacteraeota bacterium]
MSVDVAARAVAAMRERCTEPLSLAEMASDAGFSPTYFDRLFRSVTGVPPGMYQAALRLDEAKRLLLAQAGSVTEICFALGYESLGTFTRIFTESVGATPGRLRETLSRAESEGLLERMHALRSPWPAPPRRQLGVAGEIRCEGAGEVTIFAGLFPRPIPRSRPVAGQVLAGPGEFRLAPVPDGRYFLLAAAFPRAPSLLAYVVPRDPLRVGSVGPVDVEGGRSSRVELALHPVTPISPPILTALPLLAVELCAAAAPEDKIGEARRVWWW